MKYKLENHIIGKVYDLTQDNMNAMIKDIELLKEQKQELLDLIREEYEDYYRWLGEGDIHVTSEYTDCIDNLSKAFKNE